MKDTYQGVAVANKLVAEAADAIGNLMPADEWLEIKAEVPAIIKSAIEKATEWLQRDLNHLGMVVSEMQKERAARASEPWTMQYVSDLLKEKGWRGIRDAHNATLQPAHASEQGMTVGEIYNAGKEWERAHASEPPQSRDRQGADTKRLEIALIGIRKWAVSMKQQGVIDLVDAAMSQRTTPVSYFLLLTLTREGR